MPTELAPDDSGDGELEVLKHAGSMCEWHLGHAGIVIIAEVQCGDCAIIRLGAKHGSAVSS